MVPNLHTQFTFIPLLLLSFHKNVNNIYEGKDFLKLLYVQCLEQYLAHGRHSVNICFIMNEPTIKWEQGSSSTI